MMDIHYYNSLTEAIRARMIEWDGQSLVPVPLSFYGNEMAGEIGEACNIIKKLDREVMGLPGSRSTIDALADELADGMICILRLAVHLNIDLDKHAREKFNDTSRENGFKTRVML